VLPQVSGGKAGALDEGAELAPRDLVDLWGTKICRPFFARGLIGVSAEPARVGSAIAVLPRRRTESRSEWSERCARNVRTTVIPLSEKHLRRVLLEYVDYYNSTRPHRTLGLETPEGPRTVQRERPVTATPVLAGLHHRYERLAA
jgi:transposase InsO family protein